MQDENKVNVITSDIKDTIFDFKELWRYRELIFLWVKRTFTASYRQTILGPLWAIIAPLITTVVFTFFFGNIAGLAQCPGIPSFLFYMCTNISWGFFAGCLSANSNVFASNINMFSKIYFPRLVIPITTACSYLINLAIQGVMFVIFLIIFLFIPQYSIHPNAIALTFPFLVVQMMMLGIGIGIIISSLATKYRDFLMMVRFGVQLWMYATPIAYSMNIFGDNELLWVFMHINPMTPIIETIRYGFLGSQAGTLCLWSSVLSIIITLVVFIIGTKLFVKTSKSCIDVV